MEQYIAEFIGTFILVLLGNGTVANVVLKDTKGHDSGWIVITVGWGLAVFSAVAVAGPVSGAHINPAVTLGLAVSGLFSWSEVLPFIIAQIAGGVGGAFIVWVFYKDHFRRTSDAAAALSCFSTIPAIRNNMNNFFSEITGTFVLVFVILYIAEPSLQIPGNEGAVIGLGTLGALPVALLVTVIGIALGGTTGYAINPARDLGPRIVYQLLPINKKVVSHWNYSWIPILGPIAGAILAGCLYLLLQLIY